MNGIETLWPQDLEMGLLRTPFRILQDQAWFLTKQTEHRVRAYVLPGWGRGIHGASFMYALIISDGSAGLPLPPLHATVPAGQALAYKVVMVTHGLKPYPVKIEPDGPKLYSETDFREQLSELFASEEVKQAITMLSSIADSEPLSASLLPDSYDLAPVRTPVRILQEQAWALKRETDGLVRGEVSVRSSQPESTGSFRYSFSVCPGMRLASVSSLSYSIMELEHGPNIYPITVNPGGLTFNSEENFVEFLRQELASEDVRNALRLVASVAREYPVTDAF